MASDATDLAPVTVGASVDPEAVAASAVRLARGMVKVNGNAVPGWVEFETESNAYREADTFRATFALSKLKAPFDAAWFCSQTTIGVELLAGFPVDANSYGAADLDSLIVGNVDEVSFDPVQRTLEISGRDLTSLLIDAKTAEKFLNQTASDVAKTLAGRHGLTAVVTDTTEKMGTFYQIDHASLTTAQTEWDLLTQAAQKMRFVVYVQGRELHFEPAPDPTKAPKYPITWTPADTSNPFRSNSKQLSFSRTLTVGKTITVTVRSWNQKQKKGFSVSYPTNHAKGIRPGQATSPAQEYSYRVANKTQQQATQMAQAIYADLIKNEMRLSAALPGDNDLSVQHVVPVSGTGTVFDQNYFPEAITRRMSFNAGYTMDMRARNHSSDVEDPA